jgi:hypothetical protein
MSDRAQNGDSFQTVVRISAVFKSMIESNGLMMFDHVFGLCGLDCSAKLGRLLATRMIAACSHRCVAEENGTRACAQGLHQPIRSGS